MGCAILASKSPKLAQPIFIKNIQFLLCNLNMGAACSGAHRHRISGAKTPEVEPSAVAFTRADKGAFRTCRNTYSQYRHETHNAMTRYPQRLECTACTKRLRPFFPCPMVGSCGPPPRGPAGVPLFLCCASFSLALLSMCLASFGIDWWPLRACTQKNNKTLKCSLVTVCTCDSAHVQIRILAF